MGLLLHSVPKSGKIKRFEVIRDPPNIDGMICRQKDIEKKAESLKFVQDSNIANHGPFPSIFFREVQVWPRYPHRRAPSFDKKLTIVDIVVGSDSELNTTFNIRTPT